LTGRPSCWALAHILVYYVSVVLQVALFVPDDRSPGTVKFPDISLSLCGTPSHVALLAYIVSASSTLEVSARNLQKC